MRRARGVPGREMYEHGGSPPAAPYYDPWPGWKATYDAGEGTPEWRRMYEANAERSKVESERARAREASEATRRTSLLAETERRRLLREMAELSAWWDGPGSEGRCV